MGCHGGGIDDRRQAAQLLRAAWPRCAWARGEGAWARSQGMRAQHCMRRSRDTRVSAICGEGGGGKGRPDSGQRRSLLVFRTGVFATCASSLAGVVFWGSHACVMVDTCGGVLFRRLARSRMPRERERRRQCVCVRGWGRGDRCSAERRSVWGHGNVGPTPGAHVQSCMLSLGHASSDSTVTRHGAVDVCSRRGGLGRSER